MKEYDEILKETTHLSISKYLAQVIFAVRGFFIASFLGPALYGVWIIFSMINEFTNYLNLGVDSAMAREVPKNKGSGNSKFNMQIKETAFSWNIISSFSMWIIFIILSLSNVVKDYKIEIILLGVVVILSNLFNFQKSELNSEKQIKRMANFDLVYSILNTVFGLTLLFFFKIAGLLVGMIISLAILTLVLYRSKRIRFNFNVKLFKELVVIGFPILLVYISLYLMANVDKYLVFFFLGDSMTGHYGLAAFVSLIIHHIPFSLSNTLFPRMMEEFGKTKKTTSIIKYYTRPVKIISYGLPVLLAIGFFFIDPVIRLVLPEYIPSIQVLKILIVGLFFSSLLKIPSDVLIMNDQQKMILKYYLSAILVGALLDVYVLIVYKSIEAVAITTSLVFFFLALFMLRNALKTLEQTNILKNIFLTVSPAIYLFLVTFLIDLFVNNLFIQLILILIFSIPLIYKTIKLLK